MRPKPQARPQLIGDLFHPAGIDAENFVDRIYPARALVAHGSLARLGDLARLPIWDNLEQTIRSSSAERLPTIYTRGGAQRHASPEEAAATFRRGDCTVAIEDGDALDPVIAQWSRGLARELGLPSADGCKSLVVLSGRGPAVPLHVDGIEVLVVHLRGAKAWRYAPNEQLPNVDRSFFPTERGKGVRDEAGALYDLRSLSDVGTALARKPPTMKSVLMRPGSALFLPRGFWHSTVSVEPSVSITFRLRNPPAYRVVADAIARTLSARVEWQTPIPARGSSAARSRAAAALQPLLAALSTELADDAAARQLAAPFSLPCYP